MNITQHMYLVESGPSWDMCTIPEQWVICISQTQAVIGSSWWTVQNRVVCGQLETQKK